MRVYDAVRWHAQTSPLRLALIMGGLQCTYGALNEYANRITNGLASRGVTRGERVLLLLRNCCELLEAQIGLPKLGMIPVPVNPHLTPEELAAVIRNARPSAYIVESDLWPGMQTCLQNLGLGGIRVSVGHEEPDDTISIQNLIADASPREPRPVVEPTADDPFYISYTSGTTGVPKGVVRTHGSRVNQFAGMDLVFGLSRGDRLLVPGPLYYAAPSLAALHMLFLGGTCHVLSRSDPAEILHAIEFNKITYLFMVPTQYQSLLDHKALGTTVVSSVRLLISAGSAMPPDMKQSLVQVFPDAALFEYYGASETGFCTVIGPEHILERPASCGRPFPGVSLKLVDEDGSEVPAGVNGEILMRSNMVFTQYWDLPEVTAKAWHDGWLTVGDMGRMDADGFLYIVGRRADMIVSGGINIYPDEVEAVLSTHPAIREVAVVGIPDPYWGERVTALIVKEPAATLAAEDLKVWCEGRLARFKHPKNFEEVPELPRTSSGKLRRQEAKARYLAVQ